MRSNEPDDIELSLFDKILMRKDIFQQKIATDPMGQINSEREGINILNPEQTGMKITNHDNSRGVKIHILG